MSWHRVADTRQFVKDILERKPEFIAVDTETYYRPELEGAAVTKVIVGSKNNAPFGASFAIGDEGWWVTKDLHLLRPLLANKDIGKIFHNSKYDLHMLRNLGLDVEGFIWDTMLMIHLINEEQMCRTPSGTMKKSKKLKDLAYHFLGDDGHKYEDALLECKKEIAKEKGITVNMVSYKMIEDKYPEVMTDYAVADTVFTYKLFEKFLPMLEAQELMEAYNRDLKALLAVFDIERNGLKVDRMKLVELKEEMIGKIAATQNGIYAITGDVFNVNSDEELVERFTKLGLKWEWFTDKGNVSTDKNVMKQLYSNNGMFDTDEDGEEVWESYIPSNPIGNLAYLVADYRKVSKTLSTFVEGLLTYADPHDRVHADFNVCPRDDSTGGTVTGRLSSSDPNFQNLPKKDKTIRKCIIPETDFIFVEMDYAAQEYRMLAHYAKDPNLMDAIKKGWDVHKATAAIINHVDYDKVTKNQRQLAKSTNFSLIYGTGLAAFGQALKLSIDAALYNMGNFYLREKNIKPWQATLESVLPLYEGNEGNENAQKALRYYFSEEAAKAVAEAKRVKEEYFARFPMVEGFLADVIETCKARGYIKYWDGRRRHFLSPKQEAYKAPNSLIQGGCGSITKEKLARCNDYLHNNLYMSRIVNTVHDSILFEIHKEEVCIVPELENILNDNDFRVPITCDIEYSLTSWGDMKKFESIEKLEGEVNNVR